MPRKNSLDAFTRWYKGIPSTPSQMGKSIWTDGKALWSYGTAIAARAPYSTVVVNATKYSVTTSTHQKALDAFIRSNLEGRVYIVWVEGMDRGITAAELAKAAVCE